MNLKTPVKTEGKKIIDCQERVVAKVTDLEDAQFIAESCNLEYSTKAMTFDMWRIINYFNNNPEVMIADRNLEKSVRKVEKYLNKDVSYE